MVVKRCPKYKVKRARAATAREPANKESIFGIGYAIVLCGGTVISLIVLFSVVPSYLILKVGPLIALFCALVGVALWAYLRGTKL